MLPADNLPAITAEAALQKLRAGEALRGVQVPGTVDLRELLADDTSVVVPLRLEHCRLDHLSAVLLQFQRPVVLRHLHIGRLDFTFSYFLQGLTVENCTIDGYLDFQAGGHNQPGFPVQLLDNTFHGFVNFFDCWYRGPVQVAGNDFRQGANLLGAPFNIPVTFDVPPQLTGNLGRLDHHDEDLLQPE